MVSNCTIVKKKGEIALLCNIDGCRCLVFDETARNVILSGQSVHLTKETIDLGHNVWEKQYNRPRGE